MEDLISDTEDKEKFPNITIDKGDKEKLDFADDGWWDITTPNYDKKDVENLLSELLNENIEIVNLGIAGSA